jgi:hypothetical protein
VAPDFDGLGRLGAGDAEELHADKIISKIAAAPYVAFKVDSSLESADTCPVRKIPPPTECHMLPSKS